MREATQHKANDVVVGRLDPLVSHALPQEPPRYYGYWRYKNEGYADITRCQKCGNTGLYEDCHPADSCKHCGGDVNECGSGKWIKPTYTGILFWRRLKTAGYWKRG